MTNEEKQLILSVFDALNEGGRASIQIEALEARWFPNVAKWRESLRSEALREQVSASATDPSSTPQR